MTALVATFADAYRGTPPAIDEARLSRIVSTGVAAWPFALPPEAVIRQLAANARPGDIARLETAIHAADLYLACGCALGHPAAQRALDRDLVANVPRYVARVTTDRVLVGDLIQEMRTRLLVGENGPPKIATYGGSGPLGAWLRIVALRTLFNLRRGRRVETTSETAAIASTSDPERTLARAEYQEVFRAALAASVGELSDRERVMLALHYVHHVTLDSIAEMFGIHRATVMRQMAKVRERLLGDTLHHVARRLQLQPDEAARAVELARSRLDLALSGLLGGAAAEAASAITA